MSTLVCIRTFPSRNVAEVARTALEGHGVPASVSAADAGYDISFATGGAKLLVNKDSVEWAEEVLATVQESSAPFGGEVSECTTSDGRRQVIWIGLVILVLALVMMAI
jgi:hypothetical protein